MQIISDYPSETRSLFRSASTALL